MISIVFNAAAIDLAVANAEDITPDMIPHEAVHVADYFCEQLGYIHKTLKMAMKRMPT